MLFNNVATNYLETSPYKNDKTRYNIHKRSELVRVYNNIVNMNKQSPLYMFKIDNTVQNYALQLKEASMSFHSVVTHLKSSGLEQSYQSKIAVSSNPDLVSADIITEDYESLPMPFTIQVDQLASPQVNTGTDVDKGNYALVPGNYKFSVYINDVQYDFNFDIETKASNQANQIKLADFINRTNVGIRAEVIDGKKSNQSKILLTSEVTGSSSKLTFKIHDIASPNNNRGLVEYFGLDQVSTLPSNSHFMLNGDEKESLANQLSFNRAVRVNLHKSSPEEVTIDYATDGRKILEHLESVVDSYNNIISIANHYSDTQKRAGQLLNDLKNVTDKYQYELEACGLNTTDNGTLEIEESLALQAAEDGGLEEFLTKSNGACSELERRTSFLSLNPMFYVDKTIVTYPNFVRPNFPNPYITSIYSGMLCNHYC